MKFEGRLQKPSQLYKGRCTKLLDAGFESESIYPMGSKVNWNRCVAALKCYYYQFYLYLPSMKWAAFCLLLAFARDFTHYFTHISSCIAGSIEFTLSVDPGSQDIIDQYYRRLTSFCHLKEGSIWIFHLLVIKLIQGAPSTDSFVHIINVRRINNTDISTVKTFKTTVNYKHDSIAEYDLK